MGIGLGVILIIGMIFLIVLFLGDKSYKKHPREWDDGKLLRMREKIPKAMTNFLRSNDTKKYKESSEKLEQVEQEINRRFEPYLDIQNSNSEEIQINPKEKRSHLLDNSFFEPGVGFRKLHVGMLSKGIIETFDDVEVEKEIMYSVCGGAVKAFVQHDYISLVMIDFKKNNLTDNFRMNNGIGFDSKISDVISSYGEPDEGDNNGDGSNSPCVMWYPKVGIAFFFDNDKNTNLKQVNCFIPIRIEVNPADNLQRNLFYVSKQFEEEIEKLSASYHNYILSLKTGGKYRLWNEDIDEMALSQKLLTFNEVKVAKDDITQAAINRVIVSLGMSSRDT